MPPIKLPPGAQLVDDSTSMSLPAGAELVTDATFAATKDNKEGTYKMGLEGHGSTIDVPHNKVMDAYRAGYLISKDDYERYGRNREFELKKAGKTFNPDVDMPQLILPELRQAPKVGSFAMVKEQADKLRERLLDLLPTGGGITGGLLAGGAGLESGPLDIAVATAGATAGGALMEDVRQGAERRLHPYAHRLTPQDAAR